MANEENLDPAEQNFHEITEVFEKVGYSKSHAEKRIQIYDHVERSINLVTEKHVDVVIAGSRGEGVGICLDSDIDVLYIQRQIKCFANCQGFTRETPIEAIFELDFENVPNGYAKLRLVTLYRDRICGINVREALFQKNGSFYLCNNYFWTSPLHPWVGNEGFYKQQSVFADITGPARSIDFELPNFATVHIDHVQAIPCAYPTVLDAWCSRERRHNWPNVELIERIKALDILVVPTGVRDSFEEDLQWRLSMTLAERTLVRSFDDMQLKLFGAMKMLVNHELKPICKNVTSYIVKNIVFWAFEREKLTYTKTGFIDNLQYLLKFLKVCVKWHYLPNYMIPAKNMFESKIYQKEKIELMKRLDILIDDGQHVRQRCPLVREMHELPKNEFQRKIVFRELIEEVFLSVVVVLPTEYPVLKKLVNSTRRDKMVKLFRFLSDHIIPVARRTNPFGFFAHIVSMTNDEICIRLLEGIRLGYLKK